jgi:hypothetical protein
VTPEERQLIIGLVIIPGLGARLTPEEFLREFGCSDGLDLGVRLLDEATLAADGEALEYALIVIFAFGMPDRSRRLLAELLRAEWHQSHEDLVTLVGELHDPATLDALRAMTEWVPDYLGFDESQALARKAVWAILGIPGDQSAEILQELLASDSGAVREEAAHVLQLRQET